MNDINLKKRNFYKQGKLILSCFVLFFNVLSSVAQTTFPDIKKNKKEGIEMVSDSLGNEIPDFSYAGYMASEKPIPNVETKIFVPNQTEDATQKIQAAIDYVGNLKPNTNGFRGAILLDKGVFKINGTLYIEKSGVVLRGSGNNKNETQLLGTGLKREALIRVLGVDDRKYLDTLAFKTTYSPLGARKIQLKNSSKLKVSDDVVIQKLLTNHWIDALNMSDFGGETGWIGWKTRDWDITWNRVVTNIEGDEITLNAPLTMTLDDGYGKAKAIRYTWEGRIEYVGIENLTMQSTFDASNSKDELHRWLGISFENIKNAWVRQVNFKHFAGGAVSVLKSAQQITVEDCMATESISEIAGFRRHTFYTEGQQTLFQRCYSEYGYHDFAVGGYGTTGPNAFVQCESFMPYSNNGAIGSWATGVLFDVVYVDGNALSFNNREQNGRGAGWTAANSVIWESSASKIDCYSPPTAHNWAFGVWGGIMAGNGHWKDVNNHIKPRSLFYAQLGNRLSTLPVEPYIKDLGSEQTSSPTIEQAEMLTKQAENKLLTLPEWIKQVSALNSIPVNTSKLKSIDDLKFKVFRESEKNTISKVETKNGKLTFNETLLTGKKANVMWWRGSLRDYDVKKSSPHITRFVPGKSGTGFTDNLKEVVAYNKAENIIAVDHNYGLWYERRMDDHERTRRIDADVWAPFYEQPFARSGQGVAWDQLSKYDLTKYNDWYWNRLQRFASLAESEGQLLIHQQYFQHNILEAGAHWSSSPWRSANNINNTGFPEPVPYAGDKRIFMAEQFYDVSDPTRKKIHQQFIRKSLNNFQNNSNVIQLTSAEYTGPLHFMQFWIDEVEAWKEETGKSAIIGLSATKDVQDAILNDAKRNKTVDLIDIRYWHYREDGSVYAPEGGKNLAPRQHARKIKVGKETEAQVYRAVREYRDKYPEKSVLYSTNRASKFGWAVLMAGGSMANIPQVNIDGFYKSLSQMTVHANDAFNSDTWSLENKGESYLFYLKNTKEITIDLSDYKGKYEVFWMDPENGNIVSKTVFKCSEKQTLTSPTNNKTVVYIKRK
ncbi:DUF6298 domain-containing protein [Thalassobellus sediminis]|uniref:DUF6298 domain-containing protein n=1 Tax=Thalassobellus sediminis TaxID=3367753 RepID=UPI00378FD17B